MRPAFVRLRDAHHRRRLHTGVLATALRALGGCVSLPTGPSVATVPGTGPETPRHATLDPPTLLPAVGATSLPVPFGATGEPVGVNIGNPFGA
ncbi:MAG: hypothetical protein ACK52M_17255, partial [bacterium]